MWGNTFLGVRDKETNPIGLKWEKRPMPKIEKPTDIFGRVHKTTICGTDLHILGGNVPKAKKGLGLGHEGIIDIIEVGSEVTKFKPGDRVLCCCISACMECTYCKQQRYGNCLAEDGNWSLGHFIGGMQAQYVRVPHADGSCYKLPDSCPRNSELEDAYLMLADIIPTSYEIGLIDGDMADGKSVCIVGVGPVGLAAILASDAMYKAKSIIAIDLNEGRLKLAKEFGASHTILAPGTSKEDRLATIKKVMEIEDGGCDLVVECVGLPGGWYTAQEIVKPGGNIAILGVHGKPVTLNLERMWYRNFKMTAGMVHGYTIPDLMKKVEDGSLAAGKLISHHWKMSEMEQAYDLFEARRDGALKQLLVNDGPPLEDSFTRKS